MTLKILHGSGKRAEDVTGEMAERIKALIHEYDGKTTLAAAVGVLAIVQHELICEGKNE
jgi:hypothetical protein